MSTRVTVNTTRHETLEYTFEGELTQEQALELVESGEHEPDWSKIRSEDIDVVAVEILEYTNWGHYGVHWSGVEGDPIERLDDVDESVQSFEGDMEAALFVGACGFPFLLYEEQGTGEEMHWTITAFRERDRALEALRDYAAHELATRAFVFEALPVSLPAPACGLVSAPNGNGFRAHAGAIESWEAS